MTAAADLPPVPEAEIAAAVALVDLLMAKLGDQLDPAMTTARAALTPTASQWARVESDDDAKELAHRCDHAARDLLTATAMGNLRLQAECLLAHALRTRADVVAAEVVRRMREIRREAVGIIAAAGGIDSPAPPAGSTLQ